MQQRHHTLHAACCQKLWMMQKVSDSYCMLLWSWPQPTQVSWWIIDEGGWFVGEGKEWGGGRFLQQKHTQDLYPGFLACPTPFFSSSKIGTSRRPIGNQATTYISGSIQGLSKTCAFQWIFSLLPTPTSTEEDAEGHGRQNPCHAEIGTTFMEDECSETIDGNGRSHNAQSPGLT